MKSYMVRTWLLLSLLALSGLAIANDGHGLQGKYFSYVDIQFVDGDWDAVYNESDVAFIRIDPNINFYSGSGYEEYSWSPVGVGQNECFDPDYIPWIPGYGDECYGVIWTGYILIPAAGSYQFATFSDDGSAIFIDDVQVLDVRRNWFAPYSTDPIELTAGFHKIQVNHWEMTRWDGIRLEWDGSTDGVEWSVIPDDLLFIAEPCDINADWENHGHFVRCIAHEVNELLSLGAITQEEADMIVSEAARTDLGK